MQRIILLHNNNYKPIYFIISFYIMLSLFSCAGIQNKSDKNYQPEDIMAENSTFEEEVQIEFDEQELPDVQVENSGFHKVDRDDGSPCWLIDPENCPQFMDSKDILIVGTFETNTRENSQVSSEIPIEDSLISNYRKRLTYEIERLFQTELSECNGKKRTTCAEYFNKFCSDPSLFNLQNSFEHLDSFWEKNETDQWYYYVLGLLTYDQHEQIIDSAIKYITSKLPKEYVPLNNPEVQWLE